MTRVAAVDCGTNSIRLLIAEQGPEGGVVDLDRRLEIVRLGQGVDATGEFHPEALRRTFAAVDAYADVISSAGVTPELIRFVATSAARDAGNRTDFFDGIVARLGVFPDVVSGDEEAQLSFTGALSRTRPVQDPVLVMDIGGGSTELVVGTTAGAILASVSLDIGSVRLTERFLPTSPPEPADLERAGRHVDELLEQAAVDLSSVRAWVGVAGTVTTLAALALGLEAYDRDKVHGSVLTRAQLEDLLARLSAMTVAQIRSLPCMHPQRADVITAGALIATRVADAVSRHGRAGQGAVGAPRQRPSELVVSESDILDGIAMRLLSREEAPR